MNKVIDYIETHLTQEISYESLAKIMGLSVYEFRRIFTFVVGMPVGEYIRRRKLSVAACEIMRCDDADITYLSSKYGYSSPSAFTTAFKAVHGVSPSALKKGKSTVDILSKPSFELMATGMETIPIKIISTEKIHITGFQGSSDINDTDCCEAVWSKFYEQSADEKIIPFSSDGKLYALYDNTDDSSVKCTIGAKTKSDCKIDGLETVTLPACDWAVFTLTDTDDTYVAGIYAKIIYDWLPSADLTRRTDMPNVEVYPENMDDDGFEWEIRIPLK